MRLPNNFKSKIEETFYDKEITTYSVTSITDEEAWTRQEETETGTFEGNVRFDNLAQIQEDYGIKEAIDIAITTDEDVLLGSVLGYNGKKFKVISAIPYDSHNLILGSKWSSKSSTSTSA